MEWLLKTNYSCNCNHSPIMTWRRHLLFTPTVCYTDHSLHCFWKDMMPLKNIPSTCYYKQKVHSVHPHLLTYLLTFSTWKVHPLPVSRIAASLLFLPELDLHCVALAKRPPHINNYYTMSKFFFALLNNCQQKMLEPFSRFICIHYDYYRAHYYLLLGRGQGTSSGTALLEWCTKYKVNNKMQRNNDKNNDIQTKCKNTHNCNQFS